MSRKFLITLIAVILGILLLCLIGYYFIIQSGTPSGTNGGTTGFKSFFPFGGNNPPPVRATTTPEVPEQPVNNPNTNFTAKLRELSTEEVSGAGTLDSKAGTVVRYIEKATGHIFEVELFSPQNNRISNTTIPLVYDALWSSDNNSLIARYLEDDDSTVDTYSLTLKNVSTTTENTIAGIKFPGGISDVAVSGTSVFYLEQSSGFAQGFVSNFDGSKKKLIWNSEIKELNPQFVNSKTVALNTKPYPNINGYLYFVDTGTGAVKSILGNIAGLSSLVSPDATQVLYLAEGNNARLFLYNIKNKTSVTLTPTTFPEKCVWSKKDSTVVYCAVPRDAIDGSSLTSWYMGLVSFTDDIWKFDLKNNTSSIVENLGDAGEQIDVVKPILSANEQYLVFINKIDNTLWSLDLTK